MSCGVPVVATTGGALPEVVGVSEETGLLVEPDNPRRWWWRSVDSSTTSSFARASRGRSHPVMERFTWEVTARGTAACYDAILTGEALPDSMEFD